MLHENLKAPRKQKGLTQEELADRVGITPANLSILKTGKAKAVRFSTLDALCRALSEAATGRRFYAREYVATVDRGRILVERIAPGDACEVTVEQGAQRSYCGNMVLYFEACDIDDIRAYDVPEQVALLDADLLRYPLRLRRWREGDTFIPFGMEGRKKVSDYLIDRKVSLPEKQRQFVLLSGDEIVWLVGRRIDDRYRLTSETENVLRITKEIV